VANASASIIRTATRRAIAGAAATASSIGTILVSIARRSSPARRPDASHPRSPAAA